MDAMDMEVSGRGRRGASVGTHSPTCPRTSERRTLTVADVAARLEHRLYLTQETPRSVQDGCALAVGLGLSSVIARPAAVPMVALNLIGTSLGVVSMPGWRGDDVEPLDAEAFLAEARRLTAVGATDIAVLATRDRLTAGHERRFVGEVTQVVEAVRARGARVRVILDTDGLTPDAAAAACELLGTTGAWLVQAGSWRGEARSRLACIQLMRAALPAEVALKWTFPVRSLDAMMICIAEGVDRFNGDPSSLLEAAARRVEVCPLVVPVRGLDY